MTAQQFFEWVRECAAEARAMDSAQHTGASPHRSGGGMVAKAHAVADPVGAAVVAKVEVEERMTRHRARLARVVERGRQVAYLVGRAMGQDVAAVLVSHYVELYDLGVMAMDLHVSMSTIYRMRQRAFEYVDCVGIVRDDEKLEW
ncbi:MAG: hypothetical protein IKE22_08335 [Atopobiaceae bacterium]|nr:hypothetical protein [Atopobiaceae bacterium]